MPHLAKDVFIAPGGCDMFCGNGVVSGKEECDDGGNADGDGCSVDCKLEWENLGSYDGDISISQPFCLHSFWPLCL
jgi:cysteine-rich repeat protein